MTTAKARPVKVQDTPYGCEVGGGHCPHCKTAKSLYDLGGDYNVTGVPGPRKGGKIRFMCNVSAERFGVIQKSRQYPKGHCQKCGKTLIEGRYCGTCDVR